MKKAEAFAPDARSDSDPAAAWARIANSHRVIEPPSLPQGMQTVVIPLAISYDSPRLTPDIEGESCVDLVRDRPELGRGGSAPRWSRP